MITKKSVILLAGVLLMASFSYAGSFEESVNSVLNKDGQPQLEIPEPSPAEQEIDINSLNIFEPLDEIFGNRQVAKGESYISGKSFGRSAVLYTFPLKKIINKYLMTNLIFETSKGTVVHVSAAKASNCPGGGTGCGDIEKYFFVLTANGEHFFARGKKIANVSIFMRGSKTIVIDGEKYTLKLYAKLSEPARSRLEITHKGKKVIQVTMKELGDYIMEKVETVELSRIYKMSCGYELVQGKSGAHFTDKLLLFFAPYPVKQDGVIYSVDVSKITSEGRRFSEIDPAHAFRMKGENLEIFRM